MDELLTMSVVEIAGRIRKGELSPVDALEAHIRRIEEVNPKLNAVVVPRFDEARKEAKAAQERLTKSRDDLPPLFGVPCTMKDCYAVKGLAWSVGVWARRNLIADFDSTVVERIKAAGAIIMGKTNAPEVAMWLETYNHVYGRTLNPYDRRRGVGGSSGGEGAIIAAGGSPFGMGSDTGGSIRFPSAFNGVVGHKPTGRMVPGTGHIPEGNAEAAAFWVFGPMARRVSDLAYILPIVAGPDGKDPIVQKKDITPVDCVDTKNLKVFYYDSNGQAPASKDIRKAIEMAVKGLADWNIPVEYWRPEGINRSMQIWQAGMALDPEPYTRYLSLEGEKPVSVGLELLKSLFGRSKVTFPVLGIAMADPANKLLFKGVNKKALQTAENLRQMIEQKLGDNGVIICPVFPVPAPKHTWEAWLNFLRFGLGYSGVFNILEFPSTTIPIFHREDGLPVSVQVVSGRWNDHLTLAAARLLEEIFGGWKPPEKIG